MEIPTAKSLRESTESKEAKRKRERIDKARKEVAQLLHDKADYRKVRYNHHLPEEVQEELKKKGFTLTNFGEDHGVSIADAWEIKW